MTTTAYRVRHRTFPLPHHWTPAQALAVWELLDELSAALWDAYEPQLWDELDGKHEAESNAEEEPPSTARPANAEYPELPF
jgi:hypothetical protein